MLVMTLGMIMVDRIAADLPEEPCSGKTQFTKRPIEEHIGGHPANVAIDLVKLGIPPREIGVVAATGKDSGGEFIERTIRQHGLHNFLKRVHTPTGQNLILVPQGRDRSFNIAPGANLELTAHHVKHVLGQENPKVLSVRPGYSGIDLAMESILEDLQGTFILLDLMKPFNKEWSYILPSIKYATAVHCNDTEAMKITGQDTVEDACNAFLKEGARMIFITNGEYGARLTTETHTLIQQAFSVKTIDPTGCGDAFCAGIIKKLIDWDALEAPERLSEKRLAEILRYAQAVGAACATGIGTTAGVSQEKVEELLCRKKK